MSKEMSIILLGLWVMIVPYLGVPSPWRTGLLVLSGGAIALLGFLLRGQTISKPQKKTEHHTFQESTRPMSDVHVTPEVADTQEF
jgi:hypothetical protein